MVVASGTSTRQVVTMSEKLVEKIKREGHIVPRLEGVTQGDWALIDAGDGLTALDIAEIDAKGAGRDAESARLLDRLPQGHTLIALDERGKTMDSLAFSTLLTTARDEGIPGMAFAIGGADGHTDAVRQRATRLLSFGKMTWPHMLVRAMLAEQLYRALAIAANHPYHRAG